MTKIDELEEYLAGSGDFLPVRREVLKQLLAVVKAAEAIEFLGIPLDKASIGELDALHDALAALERV